MIDLHPKIQSFLNSYAQKVLIHGEWIDGGRQDYIPVINPATEEVITKVLVASEEDVHRAVESASRVFLPDSSWRKMMPAERERILYKLADLIEENADLLAQIVTLENGKLVNQARSSDALGAAKTFRYYAGWATKIEGETLDLSLQAKNAKGQFSFTLREPIGVVAAIIPWNFPLSIAAWKLAPALAAGCPVVLKPSEETPLSALYLGKLALEAGLPPGVLNVITGDGPRTGAALVRHPGIAKVTFTGSTETGKSIGKAAMDNLSSISLELGGKSPAIVFDDVQDIRQAARGVAAGIFRNQGQVCVAGSRVYIHDKIYDDFMMELTAAAKSLKVDHGFASDADLGPLISANHLDKVLGFVSTGKKEGANLISGGIRLDRKGFFMEPTIFALSNNTSQLIRKEIFGPVLACVRFSEEEEAIDLANDSQLGLSAAIWTSNLSRAMHLVNRIEAGLIFVNSPVRSDPNLPLGGYKHSGVGRELGKEGLYNYTTLKSVNIVY